MRRRRLSLFIVCVLMALSLVQPIYGEITPDSVAQRIPIRRYAASDIEAGFTNRTEHGTKTFLGWMDEAQTIGKWSYQTRVGETNTWNGTHYEPYIWNETTNTVTFAKHDLEFYDWYTVLKNSTQTVVDDMRWTVEYWRTPQQDWATLDLYDHYYLDPILEKESMSYGYRMTDGSSTANVTLSFRNCDEVKTRIDLQPDTTRRYRVTWQLTGLAQAPTILNDTIDSDGDGNNDTLGAVFDDEINFMWSDVNQTELDVWSEWIEVGKKLNVYIGNITVNADEILTIDPTYSVTGDSEDTWFDTNTNEPDDPLINVREYLASLRRGLIRFLLDIPQGVTITVGNLSLYEYKDSWSETIRLDRVTGTNMTTSPEDYPDAYHRRLLVLLRKTRSLMVL